MDNVQNTTASTSSSEATTTEVLGVKMVGRVLSSTECQPKIFETCELHWETSLFLESGKSIISSEEFVVDSDTEHESRWRIDLNTKCADKYGTLFLSVYLVLVKTKKEDAVKKAMFTVLFPTTSNLQGPHISKRAGLTSFSKEKPAHGFEKFIEMYKLYSVAKPQSTEKLRVVIILSHLKDAPISVVEEQPTCFVVEPEDKPTDSVVELEEQPTGSVSVVELENKPSCSVSVVEQSPSSSSPPTPNSKLSWDAFVKFEDSPIRVNTKRLSQYTCFFDKYLFRRNSKDAPDLSPFFSSRGLLYKIIEFCHNNGTVEMPTTLASVRNLLEASLQLEIDKLYKLCHDEILKRLTVKNFTRIIEIVKKNFLHTETAYPAIYKFMMENIRELEQDYVYSLCYAELKEFFDQVVLYCETRRISSDPTAATDDDPDDVDNWINFYLNPPH